MRALSVLLIEDDLDIAASLGDYLEAAGVCVDFAYSIPQARQRLRTVDGLVFDVLVLDVNLPGGDGFSFCRELRENLQNTTPVLFVTARGTLQDKLLGFESGGLDYVVKPFAPAELLARIRALALRPLAQRAAIQVGDYRLELDGKTLFKGDIPLTLAGHGFSILRALMEAAPGCVSSEMLVQAVWGEQVPESDPLRMHIHALRKVLQDRFGEPLILTQRGAGYRFESSAP